MELSFWPVFLLLFSHSGINTHSNAFINGGEDASILPRFIWLDNYSIRVLFPNGVEDNINLWPAEKVGNMLVPCLFEGALEADSSSSVSVSGCHHDDIVHIVMYTNRMPLHTMFNIRNGVTEEVDKVTFDNIDIGVKEPNKRRLRKRGTFRGDDYDDIDFDGSVLPDPPPFLSLDVKLAFEETLLAKVGSEDGAREFIVRVFTLGKQHMRHATLGTSIRLRAQGPIRKISNQHWKPSVVDLIKSMKFKGQNNMPVTFFCYNDDRNNETGISYTRRGCHEKKGVAIVAYRKDINQAAQTYIHESGHGLGFLHDADEDEYRGSECEGTGIMSNASTPGGRPSQWSLCSKLRLKKWLSKPENNCLREDSKELQLDNSCLSATFGTVINSNLKCDTVTVFGADYADCNGEYSVSNDRVPWLPSRPVYEHISLDRYIYWNPRGHGWSIGKKDDLQMGSYYHYSGLDSQEPWEAPWRNGIIVKCKEGSSYVAHNDGPGCLEASISSPSECGIAAASLGYSGKVQVGNWGWAPHGCLVGHPANDWNDTYFNKHTTGTTGRNIYRSLCHPGSSYVAHNDGPGCLEASISSPSECGIAAASLGYSGKIQVGNWGWAPPGCLVGHPANDWNDTYFNEHTTGTTGRNIYRSLCHPVCPSGYQMNHGDIPGLGSLAERIAVMKREDCAKICNLMADCLSFEHSFTENVCNLNREENPTEGNYNDYVFCTKLKDFFIV